MTEKGYSRRPDGGLDTAAPGVGADLAATAATDPDLVTVVGRLAASLAARFRAGGAPIDVVSCDNMAGNGAALAGVVREFVAASAWRDRDAGARLARRRRSASRTRSSTGSCRPPPRPTATAPGAALGVRDEMAGRRRAVPAVGAAGRLRRRAPALGARRRARRPGRRAVPADEAAPAQRLALGDGLPRGGRGLRHRRRRAGDGVGGAARAGLRRGGRADPARRRARRRALRRRPRRPVPQPRHAAPAAPDRLGRIAEDPRAVVPGAAGLRAASAATPVLELALAGWVSATQPGSQLTA